jgi:hypothetical protein
MKFYVFVSPFAFDCLPVQLHPCLWVCCQHLLCLPVRLPTCLYVCLPAYMLFFLLDCMSAYLLIHQSVYLPVNINVSLPSCMSSCDLCVYLPGCTFSFIPVYKATYMSSCLLARLPNCLNVDLLASLYSMSTCTCARLLQFLPAYRTSACVFCLYGLSACMPHA